MSASATQPGSSKSSELWGDAATSDITVVLKNPEIFVFDENIHGMSCNHPPEACITCGQLVPHAQYQQSSITVLKLHTSVIIQASVFLQTMLSTHMGNLCQTCRVVTFEMDSPDIEAAYQVFRFAYTNQLPAGYGMVPDGMIRIRMLKIADYWQVPSCVAACSEAMCALLLYEFPTSSVLALPTIILQSAAMVNVRALATKYVLALYQDSAYIVRNWKEKECFMALPFRAVLLIFSSDDIRPDNEATILSLLLAWYSSNACSAEQRAQLRLTVRYGCLTRSYIRTVLPLLKGVAVTPEEETELLRLASVSDRAFKYQQKEWPGPLYVCPPSWFNPRAYAGHSELSTFNIRFLVKNSFLQAHTTAVAGMRGGGRSAAVLRSQKVFAHGYAWTLALSSHTLHDAFAVEVEVYAPTDDLAAAVDVVCSIELTIFRSAGSVELAARASHRFTRIITLTNLFECGREAVAGDAHLKHWKHCLQDGHLCIQARICMPLL